MHAQRRPDHQPVLSVGHFAVPAGAYYYAASKRVVAAFTDALRLELGAVAGDGPEAR
jgi:short-subunit dehydrogenase